MRLNSELNARRAVEGPQGSARLYRDPRKRLLTGGASLWAGAYIGCGFLFARQLDKVARNISAVATAVILIFGIPLMRFFVLKIAQLVLMIRMLRPLQIDPRVLKARLDSGEKFGIVDLLRFEEDPEGWPPFQEQYDSIRLNLGVKKRIVVPDDVNLVVYCRCRNSFVSARVAVGMRKHGIHNVHVLAAVWRRGNLLGFCSVTSLRIWKRKSRG